MAENTEKKTAAERAAGLSDEVLKSVESGQRTAIDVVRKFVGAVDESISTRASGWLWLAATRSR